MGIDLQGADSKINQREGDEANHLIGELIVSKVSHLALCVGQCIDWIILAVCVVGVLLILLLFFFFPLFVTR